MFIRHAYDPIYRADVYVAIGDLGHFKAWVKHRDYDAQDLATWGKSNGKVIEHEDSATGELKWYVWFPEPKDDISISTLVHESLHVASLILRSRGIDHNEETEEAYTYYQTSIFDTLVNVVGQWRSRHGHQARARRIVSDSVHRPRRRRKSARR
jgi:hypothetical protein